MLHLKYFLLAKYYVFQRTLQCTVARLLDGQNLETLLHNERKNTYFVLLFGFVQ